MSEDSQDTGLITVLLQRFESQNLPRLLALKDKVDQGVSLDDLEIRFLKEVFSNFEQIKPLLARHPEFEPLATKAMNLYIEIADAAVNNEQTS